MNHSAHDTNRDLETGLARHDRGTRRIILTGLAALVALAGGVGGWAATAKIRAAVIAQGRVIVESNAKLVQHAEGGIVGDLLIKEGDSVAAGQVVIRLDATKTKAELEIVEQRLFDLSVRRARLIAQRDNRKVITFPQTVIKAAANRPDLAGQMEAQRHILQTLRNTVTSQLGQIEARIKQLREEINGLIEQKQAKAREIEFTDADLKRYEKLNRRRLISVTKLHDKRRQRARVDGELSRLIAAIARSKGQISEMQIRANELRASLSGEVLKELNEVEANIAELAQRRITAKDRLSRIDIRAPQAGRIHELAVHTVGGVIKPGDALMKVVPDNDRLVIEAKVQTSDIDQVIIGEPALIRFTAFSQRTTPELTGRIITVSADRSVDERTGIAYFTARIRLDRFERKKLNGKTLLPGMPADVMITAENRTVLSYLVKPLKDQLALTFREQ